ncbi:unnamed protein product [Arabidopsis lyrata]|nr:unnamed protein product [Arabidopsis lyrata]
MLLFPIEIEPSKYWLNRTSHELQNYSLEWCSVEAIASDGMTPLHLTVWYSITSKGDQKYVAFKKKK